MSVKHTHIFKFFVSASCKKLSRDLKMRQQSQNETVISRCVRKVSTYYFTSFFEKAYDYERSQNLRLPHDLRILKMFLLDPVHISRTQEHIFFFFLWTKLYLYSFIYTIQRSQLKSFPNLIFVREEAFQLRSSSVPFS